MYDNHSRGISYSAGFFMLIAFAIASLVVASFISEFIAEKMTGVDFKLIRENLGNPAYANALKVVQIVNAVVGFLLPTILTAQMLSRQPFELLGFSPKVRAQQVGLVFLIIGTAIVVASGFSYLNSEIPLPSAWEIEFQKLEENYIQQVESIIKLRNTQDYVIALIIMAFLPALCEETLFRGGLQNFLGRGIRSPWVAIIIVSALFSVVHISFYGFLSRFFLGIILGCLFHYSGKLWLSILGHFIYNATAITVMYVYLKKGIPLREAANTDVGVGGWWGLVVLPVVIGLLILFKRISIRNKRLG